ncbi:MAG TPA: glutathione S-transferase N-terminal domain-containing protein, partial [Polyangiales bacterium]
ERARWALDVRQVPYRYREYKPLLGELELRVRTKRLRGNVTVPLLVTDDGQVLDDSLAIARFASAHGEGPELFPVAHEVELAHWVQVSERALAAGRALSLRRTLANEDAVRELVPRSLRNKLGGMAVTVGRLGVERTLRKYAVADQPADVYRRQAEDALEALRDRLTAAPTTERVHTLLGSFSYADIAAAQALAFVQPPPFGLRLGRASQASFTDRQLAEKYADLVRWRDALYDAYRPRA